MTRLNQTNVSTNTDTGARKRHGDVLIREIVTTNTIGVSFYDFWRPYSVG